MTVGVGVVEFEHAKGRGGSRRVSSSVHRINVTSDCQNAERGGRRDELEEELGRLGDALSQDSTVTLSF